MHAMLPARPMELVEPDEAGGRVLRCYTAPGETFANEDEMKEHYRTELHRFNLKRKVTGLAPLSRAQFEEREARGAREATSSSGPPAKLTTAERRQQRDERREQRVAAKSKNPHSKAAHFVATAQMSEGQYLSHKLSAAPEFGPGWDLFSRHQSVSLEANLAHMAREHGFYLPYLDFCSDVAGLVHYLQQKVYIGNVALLSDRQFHSVEAVQAHMRSKQQCRVELEGHEEELGEYYDMEALAAGSPLWEIEPASDSEEEEEGEERMDEERMDLEEEAGTSDGGEDDGLPPGFDALFERAVSLGVVSEADVDAFTDAIAAGTTTEAETLALWMPAVRRAHRAAAVAACGGAGSASAGAFRVVYRPLQLSAPQAPGVDSLPTLALAGRDVGHRSMARFFRQKFKPLAGAPGSFGSLGAHRPELALLMQQYAGAGVLSSQLQLKFRPAISLSERNRGDLHREQRMFVMQGVKNNKAGAGMKHFKNQSLCY